MPPSLLRTALPWPLGLAALPRTSRLRMPRRHGSASHCHGSSARLLCSARIVACSHELRLHLLRHNTPAPRRSAQPVLEK